MVKYFPTPARREARLKKAPPKQEQKGSGLWKPAGALLVASGLLTTVVGAFYQHHQWSIQQKLKDNLDAIARANTVFDTIVVKISEAHTLQEILFYSYIDAIDEGDGHSREYISQIAQNTFVAYEKARLDLRTNINSYTYSARRNLDWVSTSDRPDITTLSGADRDPLSYAMLKNTLKCTDPKSQPQYHEKTHELEASPEIHSEAGSKFRIDWNSSAHSLTVFNYCFRELHEAILDARIWAKSIADNKTPPSRIMDSQQIEEIKQKFGYQVDRLNALSNRAMTEVAIATERREPPNFFIQSIRDFYVGTRDALLSGWRLIAPAPQAPPDQEKPPKPDLSACDRAVTDKR